VKIGPHLRKLLSNVKQLTFLKHGAGHPGQDHVTPNLYLEGGIIFDPFVPVGFLVFQDIGS